MARRPPGSPVPGWVFAGVLLIGVGWVLFFCVSSGMPLWPPPPTTKGMTVPTGPLEPTPKTER